MFYRHNAATIKTLTTDKYLRMSNDQIEMVILLNPSQLNSARKQIGIQVFSCACVAVSAVLRGTNAQFSQTYHFVQRRRSFCCYFPLISICSDFNYYFSYLSTQISYKFLQSHSNIFTDPLPSFLPMPFRCLPRTSS